MSNSSRCNGVNDCGDGSDEDGCGKIGAGKDTLMFNRAKCI